jgi:hypothetical protein
MQTSRKALHEPVSVRNRTSLRTAETEIEKKLASMSEQAFLASYGQIFRALPYLPGSPEDSVFQAGRRGSTAKEICTVTNKDVTGRASVIRWLRLKSRNSKSVGDVTMPKEASPHGLLKIVRLRNKTSNTGLSRSKAADFDSAMRTFESVSEDSPPYPSLLLGPRIRQGLGEACDREVHRRGSIDDRRNDAGR